MCCIIQVVSVSTKIGRPTAGTHGNVSSGTVRFVFSCTEGGPGDKASYVEISTAMPSTWISYSFHPENNVFQYNVHEIGHIKNPVMWQHLDLPSPPYQ